MSAQAKEEYFCKVCARGFPERAAGSGAVVVREGITYCATCFREKFPDECPGHPGRVAAVSCFVCGHRSCPDCTVELQGRRVCAWCKPWMLGRIFAGLPIEPPEVPPWKGWNEEEVHDSIRRPPRDWLGFALSTIALVLVVASCQVYPFSAFNPVVIPAASVLLLVFFHIWVWRPRRTLKEIWVNKHSILGQTFFGRLKGAKWDGVSSVIIHSYPRKQKYRRAIVKTAEGRFEIHGLFKRFDEITVAMRDICRARDISWVQL